MLQLTFVSESTVAYIATARYSSKSRLGCPVQRALMTRSDTEEFDDEDYVYGDHGDDEYDDSEHCDDSEPHVVDPLPLNTEGPASSGDQSTPGEQNTGPASSSSAGQNRKPVFRPDIWAARTSVAGPIWAPPSDHCHSVRAPWTPQIGQTLLPYRLVDNIVWVRSVEGQSGVGQVELAYGIRGYDEAPLGRAEAMETFAIHNPIPFLPPLLYWRPMWASWSLGRTPAPMFAPYPVWVVRWLSSF